MTQWVEIFVTPTGGSEFEFPELKENSGVAMFAPMMPALGRAETRGSLGLVSHLAPGSITCLIQGISLSLSPPPFE